jgi:hypothetical protein
MLCRHGCGQKQESLLCACACTCRRGRPTCARVSTRASGLCAHVIEGILPACTHRRGRPCVSTSLRASCLHTHIVEGIPVCLHVLTRASGLPVRMFEGVLHARVHRGCTSMVCACADALKVHVKGAHQKEYILQQGSDQAESWMRREVSCQVFVY